MKLVCHRDDVRSEVIDDGVAAKLRHDVPDDLEIHG